MPFNRPEFPYAGINRPNSTRFSFYQHTQERLTGDALDFEFDYIIDSLNDLDNAIQGVAIGVLPGANDANNIGRTIFTDGNNMYWKRLVFTDINGQLPLTSLATVQIINTVLATDQNGDVIPYAGDVHTVLCFDNQNNLQNRKIYTDLLDAQVVTGPKIRDNTIPETKLTGTINGNRLAVGSTPGDRMVNDTITNQKLRYGSSVPLGALMPLFSYKLYNFTDGAGNHYDDDPNYPGWVECDGRWVKKTSFPVYWNQEQAHWDNAKQNATHFQVPDLRGYVLVGAGMSFTNARQWNQQALNTGNLQQGNKYLGNTFGAEFHTLTVAEMPEHYHPLAGTTVQHINPAEACQFGGGFGLSRIGNAQTNNVGGNTPHNNVQPSQFVRILIKLA